MAQLHQCPRCGTEIGPNAPDGACPACALLGALSVHYFGDYELGEEIGRGAMGVVFRARQVSLNRIVALKMILAGRLASETEVARFYTEAKAAAQLQHPNIVRVYEVGSHDGHHYYSMDFVEGSDMAHLVRDRPMPAAEAAQYIKVIAEAVHYAHQQCILHRDLKPSNILIDPFNQPRITDFGLARQQESDPHLTEPGQLVGTPAFMPPEQAAARPDAVGPHSDVYSTGAILYYLLTQGPPFTAESLPDLLGLIANRDPLPPRELNPNVPRDLETICLKCLEKEPRSRYPTAQALAEELGRFLRDEPILARPIGPAARGWRWCKRNKALARSLATTMLLLVAGVLVSSWLAVRATRAERKQAHLRQLAESAEILSRTEAKKSQEIAGFLKEMLAGVNPSEARGRDTTLLREILDRASERISKSLKDQPEVEADLRDLLGRVYEHIGDYQKSEGMHRQALKLSRETAGKDTLNVAASLGHLGIALERQGKVTNAEAAFRESLAINQRLLGDQHSRVAKLLSNLGNALWRQGKLAEAEKLHRDALEMDRKLLGNEHLDVAEILGNLAIVLASQRKPAEAEAAFREALALQRKLMGPDHPTVAQTLSNIGNSLADQKKLAEAESFYREALALRRKVLDKEHPTVAISLNNLAELLVKEAKYEEAEALHREALAIRRKRLGDQHAFTIVSRKNLAHVLERQGQSEEAETLRREAQAIQQSPKSTNAVK